MAPFLSSAAPSIRAALRRTRAEAVRRQLEGCHLVAGIWCNGLTVRQIQDLRGALPPTARLLVAKNTVLANVFENTSWSKLNPCMRGANAWLFVHTDEIPGALKACREFQRKTGLLLNDFVGAVFEGEVYGPDEFQALETMPTKEEFFWRRSYAVIVDYFRGQPAIIVVFSKQVGMIIFLFDELCS
ncbi:hypothetical protein J5N97_013662 [Dioscorea zingiberensis]|uniref:Large ribosomal subunit protein uL10c n=1 Tax=Dioscorea zingiberensis TaxID=325984 RepID=A0A9D5CTN7_9LILI|nr:hypothetical protein J5N97_013662 [Dioscorea zingiberensis]